MSTSSFSIESANIDLVEDRTTPTDDQIAALAYEIYQERMNAIEQVGTDTIAKLAYEVYQDRMADGDHAGTAEEDWSEALFNLDLIDGTPETDWNTARLKLMQQSLS